MRLIHLTMYELVIVMSLKTWILEPFLACEGIMDG